MGGWAGGRARGREPAARGAALLRFHTSGKAALPGQAGPPLSPRLASLAWSLDAAELVDTLPGRDCMLRSSSQRCTSHAQFAIGCLPFTADLSLQRS